MDTPTNPLRDPSAALRGAHSLAILHALSRSLRSCALQLNRLRRFFEETQHD